jgi:hypothetical protein
MESGKPYLNRKKKVSPIYVQEEMPWLMKA